MSESINDTLLKISDVARLLNFSEVTIKRWIYQGKISSTKTPGGQYRIPLSEVERIKTMGQPAAGEGVSSPVDHLGQPVSIARDLLILLVEDVVETQGFISYWLRQQGHRVDLANDGAKALQLLSTYKPDLVITDLRMPDVNGFELIRAIRNSPHLSDLPVIAISIYVSKEGEDFLGYREEAFQAGANAVLSKPFDYETLEMEIVKVLS
jgi:excisionase family DNA binding protein